MCKLQEEAMDRNDEMTVRPSAPSLYATIIATKDGEIAALTAEVTHLAEKVAERDAKAAGSAGERAKALNEAWSICIAQADRARSSSGAARAMACADAIHRLAAAPQPVDAAQAAPELTIQSVTEKIKEWFPDRAGQARFFAAVLFGAPIRAIDEFEAEELRKSASQPTDTTKGA